MPEALTKIQFIAVTPALLLDFQNFRLDHLLHYSLYRTLGNPDLDGNFPGRGLWCVRQTDKYMCVVTEKSPVLNFPVSATHFTHLVIYIAIFNT